MNLISITLRVLKNLDDGLNQSQLNKRLTITYDYMTKLLKEFKEAGLIDLIKVGHNRVIKLTPKGEQLKELATQFNNLLTH